MKIVVQIGANVSEFLYKISTNFPHMWGLENSLVSKKMEKEKNFNSFSSCTILLCFLKLKLDSLHFCVQEGHNPIKFLYGLLKSRLFHLVNSSLGN